MTDQEVLSKVSSPEVDWADPFFVATIGLYAFTLALQGVAAFARWLLVYIVATPIAWVGLIPSGFVGLGAWTFALGPMIWSVSAFWYTGRGWFWRRYIGADEPSELDEKLLRTAIAMLGPKAKRLAASVEIFIYPSEDLFAFSRGCSLIVSRGLLESSFLPAVLAHELCHFDKLDARLAQALARLMLWDDPFAYDDDERVRKADAASKWVAFARRWLFRLGGGRMIEMLRPLRAAWAANFRRREEIADANAVLLGQGFRLAQFLDSYELRKELPVSHWLATFDLREYRSVSDRISNLKRMAAAEVSVT